MKKSSLISGTYNSVRRWIFRNFPLKDFSNVTDSQLDSLASKLNGGVSNITHRLLALAPLNGGILSTGVSTVPVVPIDKTQITLSTDITWNNDIYRAIDGIFLSNLFSQPGNQDISGIEYFKFDLGIGNENAITLIELATVTQGIVDDGSTWRVEASNDDLTWTDLTGTLTAEGSASTTTGDISGEPFAENLYLTGNTTAYRYYRILGISGLTTSFYLREISFLTTEISGGTSTTAQEVLVIGSDLNTIDYNSYSVEFRDVNNAVITTMTGTISAINDERLTLFLETSSVIVGEYTVYIKTGMAGIRSLGMPTFKVVDVIIPITLNVGDVRYLNRLNDTVPNVTLPDGSATGNSFMLQINTVGTGNVLNSFAHTYDQDIQIGMNDDFILSGSYIGINGINFQQTFHNNHKYIGLRLDGVPDNTISPIFLGLNLTHLFDGTRDRILSFIGTGKEDGTGSVIFRDNGLPNFEYQYNYNFTFMKTDNRFIIIVDDNIKNVTTTSSIETINITNNLRFMFGTTEATSGVGSSSVNLNSIVKY